MMVVSVFNLLANLGSLALLCWLSWRCWRRNPPCCKREVDPK